MKILCVIDMQNDFISGSLGTEDAMAIVPNVAKKILDFKEEDGYIFCTMDTHYNYYPTTQEGRKLPVSHCVRMTPGWLIHEEIVKALDTKRKIMPKIITKDSFGSVELADTIESLNYNRNETVDEVILIGLCTDICVISNAMLLKSQLPEIEITVDASCCAGVTKESHNNALKAMKQCQINVINWEE